MHSRTIGCCARGLTGDLSITVLLCVTLLGSPSLLCRVSVPLLSLLAVQADISQLMSLIINTVRFSFVYADGLRAAFVALLWLTASSSWRQAATAPFECRHVPAQSVGTE